MSRSRHPLGSFEIPLPRSASLSLASLLAHEERRRSAPQLELANDIEIREDQELVPLIVESTSPDTLQQSVELKDGETIRPLGNGFLEARLWEPSIRSVLEAPGTVNAHLEEPLELHLSEALPEIGIIDPRPERKRVVEETGENVFIGIVDTGFDLNHPAFRDGEGRLRVAGLWHQKDGLDRQYTTEELERLWSSTGGPGDDALGHGTMVASIAGGSRWGFYPCEGVAPKARFLLVRTDLVRTGPAVDWIFRQAGDRPCVVNLSMGDHRGAHDGNSVGERQYDALCGPGKILVTSAGNDRERRLHAGRYFHRGLQETIGFDISTHSPNFVVNAWHPREDSFEVALIAPNGTALPMPLNGEIPAQTWGPAVVYLARQEDIDLPFVQLRIELQVKANVEQVPYFSDWKLQVKCVRAHYGRFDAWIDVSRMGKFQEHRMVDPYMTLSLPATGRSCLAVASHGSRASWENDSIPSPAEDVHTVVGRTSSFSSVGPTLDGRCKPDISAPGEYIRGALAERSQYSKMGQRVQREGAAVIMSGTSMAAPVVTGTVALLLQKKGTLTPDEVRDILAASTVHDGFTGCASWNPAYGHGKLNAAQALAKL